MVDLTYYMSTLPMLCWGVQPRTTSQAFLAQCAESLGESTAKQLLQLQLLPTAWESSVNTAWREFDTFLRNTTAQLRQARLKQNGDRFVPHATRHLSPMTEHKIQEYMQLSSALDRELHLDKLRWDFLESISVGHRADHSALELYMLKLLLLEKIHTRQLSAGQQRFADMVETGLKGAEQVRTD